MPAFLNSRRHLSAHASRMLRMGVLCALQLSCATGADLGGYSQSDATQDVVSGDDSASDSGMDTGPSQVDSTNGPETSAGDGSANDDGGDSSFADVAESDTGEGGGLPDVTIPDASDGGLPDAGDASGNTMDAGEAGGGFNNPVQIDVTSVFNADTVATTTLMDAGALTYMDTVMSDFPTMSRALQLSATGLGLPDTAFFATSGTIHPQVQLHWSDTSNALNSRVVPPVTPVVPFLFRVPPAAYSELQLFALSSGGTATVTVTVTYADNTTNGGVSVTVPDWVGGTPAAGEFALLGGGGANRIHLGATLQPAKGQIYGINVRADATKSVTQVTLTSHGPGYFVFYGAIAY
jgi:hypothetical protein